MFLVVVSKGLVDVLELLSQLDVSCLFLHFRHVFELRQSAVRCFGLVHLKHNIFSLSNFLRSEVVSLLDNLLTYGRIFCSTHIQFDIDLPDMLYSGFYKDWLYYLQTRVYDLGV